MERATGFEPLQNSCNLLIINCFYVSKVVLVTVAVNFKDILFMCKSLWKLSFFIISL